MTGKSIVIRVAATLLTALAIVGCSSSRKAAKSQAADEYAAWHSLWVPVSVKVESPGRFSYSGIRMTMERASSVTYSIQFFGMEVGAIHLTPDSLLAYSKPQRIYVAEDIASALGGVKLPMADLQCLLIGQSFPDFDRLPAMSKGSPFTVKTGYAAHTSLPESLTIEQAAASRSLTMAWTRSDDHAALPFASSLSLTLEGVKNSPLKASITYSWDQAKFNAGQSRPFKLPTSYRKVSGRALLETLLTQK